jgi:hypothetical protein
MEGSLVPLGCRFIGFAALISPEFFLAAFLFRLQFQLLHATVRASRPATPAILIRGIAIVVRRFLPTRRLRLEGLEAGHQVGDLDRFQGEGQQSS